MVCFDFPGVLLGLVPQVVDVRVAEQRVVVEVHLGVERHYRTVLQDCEGIDLDQAGVGCHERVRERQDRPLGGAARLGLEVQRKRKFTGLIGTHADRGIDRYRPDLLGSGGRHLLDLDPAVGRGHDDEAPLFPVECHAEVSFGQKSRHPPRRRLARLPCPRHPSAA